jgi:hypothetical protein
MPPFFQPQIELLAERRGHFAHPVERPAVNDFDSDGAESLGDLRGRRHSSGRHISAQEPAQDGGVTIPPRRTNR